MSKPSRSEIGMGAVSPIPTAGATAGMPNGGDEQELALGRLLHALLAEEQSGWAVEQAGFEVDRPWGR